MIRAHRISKFFLLTYFCFGLASLSFSQSRLASVEVPDNSNSLEALIHEVQKENLKLWEFVKTYQKEDSRPAKSDWKRPQSPPSQRAISRKQRTKLSKRRHRRPPKEETNASSPVPKKRMRRRKKREKKEIRKGQRPYPESSHPPVQTTRPDLPAPPPRSLRGQRPTVGKHYKLWDFALGVRNVTDNNPDGFRHDTEIYHRISRKLPSRHKVFLEYKTVALKGEGAGFFTKTSIGFQQFLKRLDSGALYNPYLAFVLDHWAGDLETYQGVAITKKKASTDHFTTRFGVEYSLTDTTNLDFFFEDGGGHLDFVNANGSTIEVHSREKLYGFGLNHEF